MFETVADHAAWYRRRIAEILGRILGHGSPAARDPAETRDRTMARILRLTILILVAGGLTYGLWRVSAAKNPPPLPPRLPAAMSEELTYLLRNYEQNEKGSLRRGQFWVLAQGLDRSVRAGTLVLTPPQVADLLGPPDRVGKGLPLTWEYGCWLGENTSGTVQATFHGDQLAALTFETETEPREPAPPPPLAPGEDHGPFFGDFLLSSCLRDYLLQEGHAHRGPYFLTLVEVLDEATRAKTLPLTTAQAEDMLGKPDRIEKGPPRQWLYFYADRLGNRDWAVALHFEEDHVKEFTFGKRTDFP